MADNTNSVTQNRAGNTIRLADHFARSGNFKTLFADGMLLVEESANFLDGPGREAVKGLPRTASVLYASESMRLTTRLMQLASWLLLQRAVGEGEMTHAQVVEEKKKVKIDQLVTNIHGPGWDNVPIEFKELVRRSMALQKRVKLLDSEIYKPVFEESIEQENPVNEQLNLLATIFGTSNK
jgi:regulator of CtrA degradation